MEDIVERYRKRRADRIAAKLDGGKGSGKPKGYGGTKTEEPKDSPASTSPAEEEKSKGKGKKKGSTSTEQAKGKSTSGSSEEKKTTSGKKKKSSTSTSSPHGTLTHTYPNGVKEYEKQNYTMSKEEAKEWFTAYDNVIKKSFVEKMGIRSADMDYDRETGRVTAWVDNLPIEKPNGEMGKIHGKVFFQTGFKAKKTTHEKPDGSIKRASFSNIEPTFEFIGSKY